LISETESGRIRSGTDQGHEQDGTLWRCELVQDIHKTVNCVNLHCPMDLELCNGHSSARCAEASDIIGHDVTTKNTLSYAMSFGTSSKMRTPFTKQMIQQRYTFVEFLFCPEICPRQIRDSLG
jgi:hypothetical protein